MFDFENLEVYKKAKELNKDVSKFIKQNKQIDAYVRNQLQRASTSILINMAEGSGKFSKADKRNFYTIARGSVYESVSLLGIIKDENQIEEGMFRDLYGRFEIISKMLFGLIESQR